jgi:8-oxo-dGTP diphosphatase
MPENTAPRKVVAGVIERDGRVLICQRAPGSWHALEWEFPGGKVEDGEDPRDAIRRELAEELAIDAEIGREILRYEYCYAGRTPILLIFFEARTADEPRNLEFADIRWEPRERLAEYEFLEGDRDFLRRLAGGLFTAD